MPTTWPPGPITKIVELDTVEVSIGPENGILMRGWMLKPSSVSRTAVSAQSDGRVVQSGRGRSTRRPVSCVASGTVSRFVGNGCPADVSPRAAAGNASTRAASAAARRIVRTPVSPFECDGWVGETVILAQNPGNVAANLWVYAVCVYA